MLLSEYANTINSQFGEDGVIKFCLEQLGILDSHGLCLEVGASDGRECSNTLTLRDLFNWHRILIEADVELFGRIEEHPRDIAIHAAVTATGPTSLDQLVDGRDVAFLSLDIDGDDYEILHNLQMRPELICAEFNHTIPLQYNVTSPQFGCSLSALIELMEDNRYTYLGGTFCNAFFVPFEMADAFDGIDKDPAKHLDPANFTYLVSTMFGGAVAFGPQIFGVKQRFSGTIDIVTTDGEVHQVRLDHRSTRPT